MDDKPPALGVGTLAKHVLTAEDFCASGVAIERAETFEPSIVRTWDAPSRRCSVSEDGMDWSPYAVARELLESSGWSLIRTWPPFHYWSKGDHLPILVEIHNGKVRTTDVERIIQAIERARRREEEGFQGA